MADAAVAGPVAAEVAVVVASVVDRSSGAVRAAGLAGWSSPSGGID
jgi:hypothetical protein